MVLEVPAADEYGLVSYVRGARRLLFNHEPVSSAGPVWTIPRAQDHSCPQSLAAVTLQLALGQKNALFFKGGEPPLPSHPDFPIPARLLRHADQSWFSFNICNKFKTLMIQLLDW